MASLLFVTTRYDMDNARGYAQSSSSLPVWTVAHVLSARYSDLFEMFMCWILGHVLVKASKLKMSNLCQSAMSWSYNLLCVEALACQGGVKGLVPGQNPPHGYERH